jgi:hypothetical protein
VNLRSRFLQGVRLGRRSAALLIAGVLFMAGAEAAPVTPLPGQLSRRFPIDRGNPEASVPGEAERQNNPLEFGYFIQDLLEHAENARKQRDYATVALYYRAVAKAVPDRAKGWSKLCEAYEILKDRERAVRACELALSRAGVELGDYIRYVQLMTEKAGDMTAAERETLIPVLAHLSRQPGLGLVAEELRCRAGVKLRDVSLLEACTAGLAKAAPNDPKTVVFLWNLAMLRGDKAEAERLIARTRTLGAVLEDNIARMDAMTASLGGGARLGRWAGALLFAGTLIGLGLAGVLMRHAFVRRRALPR